MGTDEWQATTWAAAEALTLFDADLIAEKLRALFLDDGAAPAIPDHAVNQIAYSVGRVRLRHANVYRWLLLLLHHNSCFITKHRAAIAGLDRHCRSIFIVAGRCNQEYRPALPTRAWHPRDSTHCD
ncbi:MAG: hypothetical protein HC828_07340 [Blastochloris sp.]|nr:hypothetical protein [Blastochloris sp.]